VAHRGRGAYYISVGGDEARTRIRLAQTVNDNPCQFGKRTSTKSFRASATGQRT
jgi:hypothetical protein